MIEWKKTRGQIWLKYTTKPTRAGRTQGEGGGGYMQRAD